MSLRDDAEARNVWLARHRQLSRRTPMAFTIKINGTDHTVDVDDDTPLLWVLRDVLGMTGTKFGCGMALCGACTGHIDGAATRSCITTIDSIGGSAITTIEAIGATAAGAKIQKAWLDREGVQCGYCQSGQIMSASALIASNPHPTEADIDDAMSGTICRCGTYVRIREAIKEAAHLHVEYLRVEPPGIPTAFWRSVGPSHNVFVTESFIDELAAAAKQDPVAYRRGLLDKSPRTKAVLELAAEKAGWGQPLPQGGGRGVSVQFAFATYMAQIAEVEVAKDGAVRVRRVVCAVDCGTVVNPDTVQAQIQSAIMFGVTAALHGKITLKDGRVEQTNFDTYQILRINEAPAIDVHIVQSSQPPGGMGEAGTSAIVPAVANAIFAATGKRLRKLPVDTAALKQPA